MFLTIKNPFKSLTPGPVHDRVIVTDGVSAMIDKVAKKPAPQSLSAALAELGGWAVSPQWFAAAFPQHPQN